MIALYKEKIPVQVQDLGLWEGDIATLLPSNNEPTLNWKGAPIPASLFGQMLGFFRHANKTWDSEAMLRLAYNPETREWKLFCVPQTIGTGMHVSEIKNLTPEQQALRDTHTACLRQGFMENGSTHSHCNASAFQSGTDSANEIKNTGVHITLGNIDSDNPSVHGRVVFRGIQYKIDWAQWFQGWPEGMEGRVDGFSLVPGGNLDFPKEWLECCFEPPPVKAWNPSFMPSRYKTEVPHTGYRGQSQGWSQGQRWWEQQQDRFGDSYADDDDSVYQQKSRGSVIGPQNFDELPQAWQDAFAPLGLKLDTPENCETFSTWLLTEGPGYYSLRGSDEYWVDYFLANPVTLEKIQNEIMDCLCSDVLPYCSEGEEPSMYDVGSKLMDNISRNIEEICEYIAGINDVFESLEGEESAGLAAPDSAAAVLGWSMCTDELRELGQLLIKQADAQDAEHAKQKLIGFA